MAAGGLKGWWQARQARKVHAYLQAHPELGTAAAQAAMLELMAASPGQRTTTPWPVLSQLGWGGRHPMTMALPKVTPYNLRRFSEYPPTRRAINAICNPIVDLDWEIVLDRQAADAKREATPEEEAQIEVAAQCLRQPNGDDSWRTFLEAVLEDIVVGGY